MKVYLISLLLSLILFQSDYKIGTVSESTNEYNSYNITLYTKYNEPYNPSFILSPIIFINKQNFQLYSESSDYNNFKKYIDWKSFKYDRKQILQSEFIISQSNLKSCIPEVFYKRGIVPYLEMVSYQGELSINHDTIFNWHMIPPYPKVNPKLNEGVIESYTKPRMYIKYPLSKEQQNQLIDIFKSKGLIP